MQSFGEVQRIGIESTGRYGAGLLRFVQQAGIEVLEHPPRISTIGADGARTMILMRRMPRMPPLPAYAPSPPEAVTEWSNPYAFSRLAGRRSLQRAALPCK
jgi:hypothetical protein